ncbi:MAG: riboflavin synthase [Anaerovoracaceae bacterium]
MFTGIVEETGSVIGIEKGRKSSRLNIKGNLIFDDLKLGDSVAVNGVCLTASALGDKNFVADVMSETLERSALGRLKAGSRVNLERALPAWGRFGGHIVSGHIDGVGYLSAIREDDNARWLTINAPENIMRYVIEKGSIAIDGVSLTIATVSEEYFKVSIIPHTGKATTLFDRKVNDPVNLENDMIGKYIEKFLGYEKEGPVKEGLTEEFLIKAGF